MALLAGAAFIRFGATPRAFTMAFLVAVLVLLSVIDLEQRILPNRIVLPSAALVLTAQVAFYPDRALEWVLAALGAAAFLALPLLAYPSGMGIGDVKLALLLGAALGGKVFTAILLGFVAVLPVALFMLARHGAAARKAAIPFGPFLAFGAAVVALVGAGGGSEGLF
jgi:leader peptidase (prepilin peptidase)/N-methyltransferase